MEGRAFNGLSGGRVMLSFWGAGGCRGAFRWGEVLWARGRGVMDRTLCMGSAMEVAVRC
jgi:hypothetical protein